MVILNINDLIRKSLRKFSPYQPGEQPATEGWVKLNTNEHPYPPLPEIIEEMKASLGDRLRKYPDPNASEVKKAILNQLLRDKDTLTNRNSVFIGNGCDEVLENLFKAFIDPGDDIVYFYPSYGMYSVLAELFDAEATELKLNDDFSLPDIAFSAKGKLLFLNSPNNPNGKSYDNDTIQKLCQSFPGLVIVDETYADFSDTTALSLLKKEKNLLIARTFSKSFSLASLRFGYAIADPSIIKELNKVKLPYNVNYMAQIAALACIKHRNELFERNKNIISERKRVSEKLDAYEGINVLPSDANFIFVRFDNKSQTLKYVWDLKDRKILVRHFSKPGLYEFIRISIGTEEENNKFLEAFDDIFKKYS